MEILETIFLGVVSGVITTIVFGVAYALFRKVFVPWYEQRIYRGVNISGAWTARSFGGEANERLDIFLNLTQKAHRINGTFHVKNTLNENEYTNYFNVEGEISDNHLILVYKAMPQDRTGMGAFLLRVAHGGTELRGNVIFTADADPDDSLQTIDSLVFQRS